MKKLLLIPLTIFTLMQLTAQDYFVDVSNFAFTPSTLTINVGETVQWDNSSGTHNVNGSQATFPANPESFINGAPASGSWTYSYTFNTPGTYEYLCDQHPFSMTGTITVVGGGYPIYDIATINTVDMDGVADSLDVVCEIQGTVYGGDFRGGDGVSFTIHDGTGGINVFDFANTSYTVTEGDELIIRGEIGQFSGLTQMGPDTIIFLSAGNPIDAPTIVTALDESTESELIRINGVSVVDPGDWTNSGSGFNVDITDGVNTYTLRVDNDVDLFGEPAPVGVFDVIGLGGQFDSSNPFTSGYQILPRGVDDIIPVGGDDPLVFFDNEGLVVNEDVGTIQIPVTIEGGNANPTEVTVILSTLSNAVEGMDFNFTWPVTITFAGGVSSETQFLDLEIIDDLEMENTEQAVFALVNPTNNATVPPSGFLHEVVIQDNDTQIDQTLILTGVYDGPLPGGQPKGVEIYVAQDIPDLSIYGIGSANNGEGSDGEEFTFPAESATAGSYIFVTPEPADFEAYFGFPPTYEDTEGATNINGDDAVELFENGVVIDVFGDINTDGSGEPWEYLDSWAYRVDGTGPDGTTFVIGNWMFGGVDVFDGTNINDDAANPMPIGTYQLEEPEDVVANDDNISVPQDDAISFNVLNNDFIPNGPGSVIVVTTSQPTNGDLVDFGEGEYTYTPDPGYCGPDMFTYEACDNGIPSCDVATVFIDVECPVDYPAYDIGTVSTTTNGDPDSLGVSCQIQGIVYGVDLQPDDNILFTIIDATGGIAVFSSDNFGYTVQEGDEIILQGEIGAFNCLTQMNPVNLTLVSTDNQLVDPLVVTDLDESTESELVRLNDVTPTDPSQWDNMGSGMNIDVVDGSGSAFTIRIDDGVDLYSMPIPGFPWDVIGIGGQFDNDGTCDEGYQLLPRYMEDIISIVGTSEADLSGQIRVFPNPVSGELFWQTALAIESVEITDALGRTLASQMGNQRSILVDQLPAGVYLIRFRAAEGQHTEMIIVE